MTATATRPPYLTDCELAAIKLVAAGKSYEQIGRELFKTRSTVKTQVDHARERWGARNRAHLVVLLIRAGWLA